MDLDLTLKTKVVYSQPPLKHPNTSRWQCVKVKHCVTKSSELLREYQLLLNKVSYLTCHLCHLKRVKERIIHRSHHTINNLHTLYI